MKRYSLVFGLAMTTVLHAQNCVISGMGLDPDLAGQWAAADRAADGHIVGAITDQNQLGDVLAVKTDPSGELIWQKYIATTNSVVRLEPSDVVATPDGGMAIFGFADMVGEDWNLYRYYNQFLIRLDQDGEILWARYYLKHFIDSNDWTRAAEIFVLPDGDLLMSMGRSDGIIVTRLDANGLPVSCRRYGADFNVPSGDIRYNDLDVAADGSMTFLGGGFAEPGTGYFAWLMRTTADGTIEWSNEYRDVPFSGDELVSTGSGDLMMFGSSTLSRFGADGMFHWAWDYYPPMNYIHAAGELANGDLLLMDPMHLVRADALGGTIEAWGGTPSTWKDLVGISGDSVYMTGRGDTLPWIGEPHLTLAPSIADLGCPGSPLTVTPTSLGSPTLLPNSGFVVDDTVKTWTMSLSPPVEYEQLDLQLSLTSGAARPGFDMDYYAGFANRGGLTSGPIAMTMTFDPLLTFVSADPAPTTITSGSLTWEMGPAQGFNYSNSSAIHARFLVSLEATLGNDISTSAIISQDSTEVSLANNTGTCVTEITGSYDPNDKLVWPRDFYHIENDSVLTYTIRFQNTGTAEAVNVVVQDTLPLDVDTRTFELGATSHPCIYSLTGNGILTFTFENIMLPDSNTNAPLSHGLVNFSIRPILPLQLGQEITNAADIYFDFNPPIHTPAATVVVTDETGVRPLVKPAQLVVYPVPAKNTLTAVLPEGFTPVQAFVIGVDDRRLPMVLLPSSADQVQFATQHLPAGAYVLTLRAQDGKRLSARFVKE